MESKTLLKISDRMSISMIPSAFFNGNLLIVELDGKELSRQFLNSNRAQELGEAMLSAQFQLTSREEAFTEKVQRQVEEAKLYVHKKLNDALSPYIGSRTANKDEISERVQKVFNGLKDDERIAPFLTDEFILSCNMFIDADFLYNGGCKCAEQSGGTPGGVKDAVCKLPDKRLQKRKRGSNAREERR